MVDAFGAELESNIATKADLYTAVASLEESIAIIKWMLGFALAFVVALTWHTFA